MKKFAWVALLLGAVFVGGLFVQPRPSETVAESPAPRYVPPVYHAYTQVFGSSMEPTIKNGQYLKLATSLPPAIGDVIGFDCPELCRGGESEVTAATKRLVKVDDKGCWWVLGDNTGHSWDSEDYGWICEGNRVYEGKVVEILDKLPEGVELGKVY